MIPAKLATGTLTEILQFLAKTPAEKRELKDIRFENQSDQDQRKERKKTFKLLKRLVKKGKLPISVLLDYVDVIEDEDVE